jgi:hypothetical protein
MKPKITTQLSQLPQLRHLLKSTLEPLVESMLGLSILGLIELLELLRLCARWSLGLKGFSPLCLAKRFRISVSEITPVKRPEILAPGNAAADTAGKAVWMDGEAGVEFAGEARTAWVMEGVASGVAGAEGDGEAASTTHIRWERVATSFATVCAKVE